MTIIDTPSKATQAVPSMSSVSKEKKNRVMEVLLSSMTPAQMMTGKVVGLGLLSFIQVFVWVGGGSLLLRQGGEVLQLPAGFDREQREERNSGLDPAVNNPYYKKAGGTEIEMILVVATVTAALIWLALAASKQPEPRRVRVRVERERHDGRH